MKDIFIGIILVLFDLDINYEFGKLGLIPDAIGFIYLREGFKSLEKKSPIFESLVPHGELMIFYSVFGYIFNMFGLHLAGNGLVGVVCEALCIAHLLYVLYKTILGVMDMEKTDSLDYKGQKLLSNYKIFCCFMVIASMVAAVTKYPLFIGLAFIANAAGTIYFLTAFYESKKAFESTALRS